MDWCASLSTLNPQPSTLNPQPSTLRDSCASVRREAARREALASRGQGEWNNSPSSPLGKIEPSNLFSQPPTPPYPSNAAVASKDIDQQRHSAVTTSDDSPSGGDRSKEDHTAGEKSNQSPDMALFKSVRFRSAVNPCEISQ